MSEQLDHTDATPPAPALSSSKPKGLLAALVAGTVVLTVAAGGFAAWRAFSGTGPRPAEVLPTSVFALGSIDLDPAGGQKLEAIRTLRSFPSFERTGLGPDSDPVRWIFERAQEDDICTDLDYDRDVKSWIGQRAAVGGAMLDGAPVPVGALQVSDPDNARTGFRTLLECASLEGDEEELGWTLAGDYLVLSDSTAHAEALAKQGMSSPLSEDAAYQRWTEEAGGPGVMNFYLAPDVVDVAAEQLGDSGGSEKELADAFAAYRDFRGAAAVLRFADGGIELAAAGGGGGAARGSRTVAAHVGAMPDDTALLLALAVPPAALEALTEADSGAGAQLLGGMLGIEVPGDLETLLGESLSVSLGGTPPADLGSLSGPGDLSLGALVRGDVEEIETVIAKLERSTGSSLATLGATLRSGDGKVAVASNPDYAEELLGSGALARDDGFRDVVPNADEAQFVLYADLDGAWGRALTDLVRQDGDESSAELADNLEVVRGFGVSAWTDGEVSRGLVRLGLE